MDAVIYYRVFDPVRAACRVLDYNQVTPNILILNSVITSMVVL